MVERPFLAQVGHRDTHKRPVLLRYFRTSHHVVDSTNTRIPPFGAPWASTPTQSPAGAPKTMVPGSHAIVGALQWLASLQSSFCETGASVGGSRDLFPPPASLWGGGAPGVLKQLVCCPRDPGDGRKGVPNPRRAFCGRNFGLESSETLCKRTNVRRICLEWWEGIDICGFPAIPPPTSAFCCSFLLPPREIVLYFPIGNCRVSE